MFLKKQNNNRNEENILVMELMLSNMITNGNKGINIKDIEKDLKLKENSNRKIHITKQLARNYGVFIHIFNGLLYLDNNTCIEQNIPLPTEKCTMHSGAKNIGTDTVTLRQRTTVVRSQLFEKCRRLKRNNFNKKSPIVTQNNIQENNSDTRYISKINNNNIDNNNHITNNTLYHTSTLPTIPEIDTFDSFMNSLSTQQQQQQQQNFLNFPLNQTPINYQASYQAPYQIPSQEPYQIPSQAPCQVPYQISGQVPFNLQDYSLNYLPQNQKNGFDMESLYNYSDGELQNIIFTINNILFCRNKSN